MYKNLIAIAIGILFSFILIELASQIYFRQVLVKHWDSVKNKEAHYFQKSNNPILGYKIKKNFHYRNREEGRELKTDANGIRITDPDVTSSCKIALAGDSLTFGEGLSQRETIAYRLQEKYGSDIKVLNYGVNGYEISQIYENLKIKNSIYHANNLIYILNLNDFSRKNSIYEGSDGGLYRMYNYPFLKSPLFIRKLIYRYNKQDLYGSTHWYQWYFNGNKTWGLGQLKEMAKYAKDNHIKFAVFMFPSGIAMHDNIFELQNIFDELIEFFKKNNIAYIDPVNEFLTDPKRFINKTDHPTAEGAKKTADIIWQNFHPSCQN